MIRRSTVSFVLALAFLPGLSQAQSQPVSIPSKMQLVVGDTVLQYAAKRGFAANDPRVFETLRGVSKALSQDGVAIAAGTVAGLAVAGTSPGWMSVAGEIALQLAVGYAINVAADATIKWAFGPGSTPLTTYVANGAPNYTWQPSSGGVCHMAVTTDFCAAAGAQGHAYQSTPIELYPITCLVDGQAGPTYPCFAGTATTVDQAMAQSGYSKVTQDTPGTPTPNQTVDQAVSGLSISDKAKPFSTDSIALLVNGALQQASSDPTYKGIPYSPANKVTPADVAGTDSYKNSPPSVGDAVAPQANPAVDFSPAIPSAGGSPAGSTGASGSTSSTSTTVTPDTTSNPDAINTADPNATKVDLGPDPGVGAPMLENTPTPNMILDPILNLMPSLKNYAVPPHSAICPKPTFDVFGKSITMVSHCDLLESQRTTIYTMMLAVYALASLFIFLRA